MSSYLRANKGFTLIELLTVVAIIGILAAIAIPQFSAYRQGAFNSAAFSDLKSVKTAMEAFASDRQAFPEKIFAGDTEIAPGGGSSRAGEELKASNGSEEPKSLFAPSRHVAFGIMYDTTKGYSIVAKNESGSKEYGVTSADTSIYVKDLEPGKAPDVPTAIDASAFSDWSTM